MKEQNNLNNLHHENALNVTAALKDMNLSLPYKPLCPLGNDVFAVKVYNEDVAKFYKQLAEYGITEKEYNALFKLANKKTNGQNELYTYLQNRKQEILKNSSCVKRIEDMNIKKF